MLSETPVRAEGVCSPSVGQGTALTSRSPRCVAPRRSHTLSACASGCEAYRAELPAEKEDGDERLQLMTGALLT